MNINKNGFYKLSELGSEKISIGDNLEVSVFDDLNINLEIDIGERAKVKFYGLIDCSKDLDIKFNQNKFGSELDVKYLLLSKQQEKLKVKIFSELGASKTKSDVKIITIVGDSGFVDLDGIVQINKGIEKVEGNLSEENIFLGSKGKIKGIPTLLVRSNDVKASHSCKMERISDDQLFYLRSRGIEKESSIKIMLEAKVKNHFKNIELLDEKLYDELINQILKKIY